MIMRTKKEEQQQVVLSSSLPSAIISSITCRAMLSVVCRSEARPDVQTHLNTTTRDRLSLLSLHLVSKIKGERERERERRGGGRGGDEDVPSSGRRLYTVKGHYRLLQSPRAVYTGKGLFRILWYLLQGCQHTYLKGPNPREKMSL